MGFPRPREIDTDDVVAPACLIDQPSVLRVNTLFNGGQASSIGASGTAASNLVLNGSAAFPVQLQYVGSGSNTNREFTANGLAPSNPKESGIFTTLPPGTYTAVLAGQGSTSGIGLIEVYNLK